MLLTFPSPEPKPRSTSHSIISCQELLLGHWNSGNSAVTTSTSAVATSSAPSLSNEIWTDEVEGSSRGHQTLEMNQNGRQEPWQQAFGCCLTWRRLAEHRMNTCGRYFGLSSSASPVGREGSELPPGIVASILQAEAPYWCRRCSHLRPSRPG